MVENVENAKKRFGRQDNTRNFKDQGLIQGLIIYSFWLDDFLNIPFWTDIWKLHSSLGMCTKQNNK